MIQRNRNVFGAIRNRTKYRKITVGETLYVILDIGNEDGKGMILGCFGEERIIPQCVWMPHTSEYKNLKAAYKTRKQDYKGTVIFEKNSQGFVVGAHPKQSGRGKTSHGHSKYTADQYGAVVIAFLLELYPEGHPNVVLVLTHPAKLDRANIKAIWKSVAGIHNIKTVDDRTVVYNVSDDIHLIEESVAAFQTFTLNTRGKPYSDPRLDLAPGDEFFMIDVGSWISYMGMGVVNEDGGLEANVLGSSVVQTGISNVLETLESELKSKFPELAELEHLPTSMLVKAIRDGVISIKGGTPKNCETCVSNAMDVLISALSTDYNGKFKQAVTAAGIEISGGGGDLSFAYLCSKLLEGHENVVRAELEEAHMRFGAIRGAAKGLIPLLKMESMENVEIQTD